MARATTKADLITSADRQFDKMWKLIDSMSEEEQATPFSERMAVSGKETHWKRDKNLRDVLVHLYEWHRLLLDWVRVNSNGESRPFLPAPYNWRTYPAMNVAFWEKHQGTYSGALFSRHEGKSKTTPKDRTYSQRSAKILLINSLKKIRFNYTLFLQTYQHQSNIN